LFLFLLLTDTNFLLQSRYDWGPVALAFLLRMMFIGVWLKHLGRPQHDHAFFVLGAIVGVAIFEKLSSTVLVGPLAMILLMDRRSRLLRTSAFALAGIFFGSLPVIAVNIHSLAVESRLFALSATFTSPSPSTLSEYAANYVALGNGEVERRFLFAAGSFRWAGWLEGAAVVSLMLLVGVLMWGRARADYIARIACVAAMCYLSIGVSLRYLPAETAEHHWLIGTPFQYLAIALATASVCGKGSAAGRARVVCLISLVALSLARAPALVSALEAIRDDRYAGSWDPSVNAAALFAARQPENAVFIAADWGIATQVFCLADGRPDFVFEPFWDYQGRETLDRILDRPGREFALVAASKPRTAIRPQATVEIFADLAARKDWVEVALDPWVQNLGSVEMHAFRRIRTAATEAAR
jgi:hypothetical protein